MNAIQALSLRKPEARNIDKISNTLSEAGSRFSKKSNIKDILVRNFFRKYPLESSVSDMQQLQIERQVANEMESFVNSNAQINSKNLYEFETRLATEVNLHKRVLDGRTQSNLNLGIRQNKTTGNTQREDKILSPGTKMDDRKNSIQGQSRHKANVLGANQQFQLPSINSHAALGINNKSVDNPRNGFNGLKKLNNNRRSQIVTGVQQATEQERIYGGRGAENYGHRGLTKLRTTSNVQNKRHDGIVGSLTLESPKMRSSSGMRQLMVGGTQPGEPEFPQTTKQMHTGQPTNRKNNKQNSLEENLEDMLAQRKIGSQPLIGNTGRQTKISGDNKSRVKGGRTVDVENLPSDISEDEWGEIQKFGQKLHEEQIRRQKEHQEKQKKQVRDVLDQQVKLRAELREKTIQEKEDFDKRILEQAKKEMEKERKMKQDLHQKVIEQKKMRDMMLKESKQKQIDDELQHQLDEKHRVAKLNADLEEEKRTKAFKKVREREAALRVIKENMNEKQKRSAELQAIKKADAEQVEMNMRLALKKEKDRENAIAERGRKIQAVMDSMVDVIKDDGKELQLKQEREYIQQCIEKDEQAHLQDIHKKHQSRVKHQMLNETLAAQVREKELRAENDAKANKSYMNRWIERSEADSKARNQKEEARKKQLLDNQQFLRDQMYSGSAIGAGSSSVQGSEIKIKKKYELGGKMNPDEARMNRMLLQEISRVKRGEGSTSIEMLRGPI